MTAQAPYESLTSVADVQRAILDDRDVFIRVPGNGPHEWHQTFCDDAQVIHDDLAAGYQYRAALPERAPVSAGGDAETEIESALAMLIDLIVPGLDSGDIVADADVAMRTLNAGSNPGGAALTTTYIQEVPDKCDRIIWRGCYFHLPKSLGGEVTRQAQAQGSEADHAQAAAARAQDAETDDYLLHALANAVEAIPVPREGFKAGWRDEEIWEWALRTAARAIRSTTRDGVAERDYAALQARIAELEARNAASERDAGRWRWTSQRAWFVDAGAYAFDLRFGPGDFTTEPRNADADDVQKAIDEAMAEDEQDAINAHAQGQAGEEKDG